MFSVCGSDLWQSSCTNKHPLVVKRELDTPFSSQELKEGEEEADLCGLCGCRHRTCWTKQCPHCPPFAPGDLLSQHWGQKARGQTDTQSTKLRAATGFYLAPERQDKEGLEERVAELRGAEGQLRGICQPRFSTEALRPQACIWSSGTAKGTSGGLPRTRASVGRWQVEVTPPSPDPSPHQARDMPGLSARLREVWFPLSQRNQSTSGHQD